MKAAVIGAGFCGLAVAWHLLQRFSSQSDFSLTLFDSRGIGQGTSGIAAGLLHPFSGAHAKLNWRGIEGMQATQELLETASLALGRPVAAKNQGILRLALTAEQQSDFQLSAKLNPESIQWLDAHSCQKLAPGSTFAPGLWIKEGLTVYSSLYLQGLWQACAGRGALFENRSVDSLHKLGKEGYDLTIVATGAETPQIEEFASLPLKVVKGQVLELAWPHDTLPLSCSLNSQIYLLMGEKGLSCLAGSTYEKEFLDARPDLETAKKEILPKLYALFPPLEGAAILNCSAGLRAVGPQHRPLIKQISPAQWIITGMGSKGLLYHALFAKELVESI